MFVDYSGRITNGLAISKANNEFTKTFTFITTALSQIDITAVPVFLNHNVWKSFVINIIFNNDLSGLPTHAWNRYKMDAKRTPFLTSGLPANINQIFPSSETVRETGSILVPKDSSDHSDSIVPVMRFPLHDGLMIKWGMEDNLKAGDYINTDIESNVAIGQNSYLSQQPLRYCDLFGGAELYEFRLFKKTDWDFTQAQGLPKAVIEPTGEDSIILSPIGKSVGLEKDNREVISYNYQLNLLHRTGANSDNFIIFPNIFGKKDSILKCCLLDKEVGMFDQNINISGAIKIEDNVPYELIDSSENGIEIRFPQYGHQFGYQRQFKENMINVPFSLGHSYTEFTVQYFKNYNINQTTGLFTVSNQITSLDQIEIGEEYYSLDTGGTGIMGTILSVVTLNVIIGGYFIDAVGNVNDYISVLTGFYPEMSKVKSIAFYSEDSSGLKTAYIIKNVGNLAEQDKHIWSNTYTTNDRLLVSIVPNTSSTSYGQPIPTNNMRYAYNERTGNLSSVYDDGTVIVIKGELLSGNITNIGKNVGGPLRGKPLSFPLQPPYKPLQ